MSIKLHITLKATQYCHCFVKSIPQSPAVTAPFRQGGLLPSAVCYLSSVVCFAFSLRKRCHEVTDEVFINCCFHLNHRKRSPCLSYRLGRCFCYAEVATGNPHPQGEGFCYLISVICRLPSVPTAIVSVFIGQ